MSLLITCTQIILKEKTVKNMFVSSGTGLLTFHSISKVLLDCKLPHCKMQIVFMACLLNPWSRVLLEKLTYLQLVRKFPAFYEKQRFITAFTSACHLFLSWASLIQSMLPHPTSWRSEYYPPIYALVFQIVFFRNVSTPKPCEQQSFTPLYNNKQNYSSVDLNL